jgi:hypothetical protein
MNGQSSLVICPLSFVLCHLSFIFGTLLRSRADGYQKGIEPKAEQATGNLAKDEGQGTNDKNASKPVSRILSSAKGRKGDHSSSPVIAGGVKRPTRELPVVPAS